MTSPSARQIAAPGVRRLTADQLDGMAETAERGLSRFGKLSFMAMALREEAARQREYERQTAEEA